MTRKKNDLHAAPPQWREPALESPDHVVDLTAWRDSATDPEVVALLRDVCHAPPYARVDWTRLHAAVVRDAARPLARRRMRAAWLGAVAGWAVAAVPAGVLAGAAAAYVLAVSPITGASATARATGGTVTSVALAGVVTGAVTAQTLADSVSGPLHVDAIVRGLVP